MTAGIKLTQKEAEQRFVDRGFVLLDNYQNQIKKVSAYCQSHQEFHDVLPGNIFRGQGLKCCQGAKVSASRSGSVMSDETKAKLSEYRGEKSSFYGRHHSEETKEKIRSYVTNLHSSSLDFEIKRARNGKTSGVPGFFYIAQIPNGLLKLGSIARLTIKRRMELLAKQYGKATILMLVKVSDAGDYEASMMERLRPHWLRGEIFSDFLSSATMPTTAPAEGDDKTGWLFDFLKLAPGKVPAPADH